jgi:nicotinate-nucleotide pyrophosphorylase (carboxylating)
MIGALTMQSIDHLIDLALQEDIGPGDITTEYLISPNLEGEGIVIAKEPVVVAGLDVAEKVFRRLDPDIRCASKFRDGDDVPEGETILNISGTLRALLTGERTALNFLQRLSGIATNVRAYAERLKRYSVRLVDTRKTTPGWRVLEKYAVRVGGARNHRMGLFDGVLIKDNHIAACGGIHQAVANVRGHVSHLVKIEVEVTDLSEAAQGVEAGADVIMLDNMEIEHVKQAVRLINGRAEVEVSGRVTQDDIEGLAEAGVDIISVGALTHSSKSVDLSMRIVPR